MSGDTTMYLTTPDQRLKELILKALVRYSDELSVQATKAKSDAEVDYIYGQIWKILELRDEVEEAKVFTTVGPDSDTGGNNGNTD